MPMQIFGFVFDPVRVDVAVQGRLGPCPAGGAGENSRPRGDAEITAHLDRLGEEEMDRCLHQYQRASGRVANG